MCFCWLVDRFINIQVTCFRFLVCWPCDAIADKFIEHFLLQCVVIARDMCAPTLGSLPVKESASDLANLRLPFVKFSLSYLRISTSRFQNKLQIKRNDIQSSKTVKTYKSQMQGQSAHVDKYKLSDLVYTKLDIIKCWSVTSVLVPIWIFLNAHRHGENSVWCDNSKCPKKHA